MQSLKDPILLGILTQKAPFGKLSNAETFHFFPKRPSNARLEPPSQPNASRIYQSTNVHNLARMGPLVNL